jgi:multidrug efflux pump subunit AcrA (membrane-fusion protein)
VTTTTKPTGAETRFAGVAHDPEALDELVGVTPVRGWLALGVVVVALLVGTVWAVTATVPQQFSVAAVIETNPGPTKVITTATGSIEKLSVEPGQVVAAGDQIASVRTLEGALVPVRAHVAGVVLEVLVGSGTGVRSLDTIATTSSTTSATDAATVVTFVSAERAGPYFNVGGRIHLDVVDVSAGLQQTLAARITSVAEVPTSLAGITAEVGRPGFAKQLYDAADGNAYRVEATIDRRGAGLRPAELATGQVASVTVVYSTPHPIDLLFGGKS